jgi:hypothetical protein
MFIRPSQKRGPRSAPTPGPVESDATDRPGVPKISYQHCLYEKQNPRYNHWPGGSEPLRVYGRRDEAARSGGQQMRKAGVIGVTV